MNMTYASQSITERIIPVEEYDQLQAKLHKAIGLLRKANILLEVEGYPSTIRAEIAAFLEGKEV